MRCRHEKLTDGSELGPHVYDHDGSHDESQNVHKVGTTLEDDGVGQLNVPRITVGLDASGPSDARGRPNQGAERNGRLATYRLEVAEAHNVSERQAEERSDA